MAGFIARALYFFAVMAVHASGVVAKEASVCSSTSIKNGGFEMGDLHSQIYMKTKAQEIGSWKFSSSRQDVGTIQVVNTGDGSAHSAQIITGSKPNASGTKCVLSQAFAGCESVNYTISWSVFQVKDKTIYGDGKYNYIPSLQVNLDGPTGPTSLSYGLAYYNLKRNNFTRTDDYPSVTFQPGVWVRQTTWLKLRYTGSWTLNFVTYSATYPENTIGTSTTIRIDKVVINPVF